LIAAATPRPALIAALIAALIIPGHDNVAPLSFAVLFQIPDIACLNLTCQIEMTSLSHTHKPLPLYI
jgi:hypothetical protein